MRARRSPFVRALGFCCVGFTLYLSGLHTASAQDDDAAEGESGHIASVDEASDQEARGLFEAGERAFSAGRFERALEHFRRAYELSRRADLLYNIGVTADRLRLDDEALEAFEAFLASGPEEALRVSVQARVDVLRRSRPSTVESDETETREEARPPAHSPDLTVPIALLVSGAVLAVAGAGLLVGAAAEDSVVQNAPTGSQWAAVAGRGEAAEALAISDGIGLGLGLALATLGGVVWGTSDTGEPAASVAVRPGGLMLRVGF